jgi:elongation factor Ts
MAQITAEMVRELREKTGAGILECKKALTETDGDMTKAAEALQKAGLAKAAKKQGRVAAEGIISAYVHSNTRIGVLLEVNCETDFVARNEDFVAFSRDVAMQIAAMSPLYVRSEEVPAADIEKQRELFADSDDVKSKPANIRDKIVDGKVKKWFQDVCLLNQTFVKNPDVTIEKLQTDLTAKIGEKISIRRFVRFEVGEGIEKRQGDFAAEVAAQVAGSKS